MDLNLCSGGGDTKSAQLVGRCCCVAAPLSGHSPRLCITKLHVLAYSGQSCELDENQELCAENSDGDLDSTSSQILHLP
ncbi:hypothetical protein IF2G_00976 [Cordyceps javanica]|nr:hypothetical protein IF2G_00976 [Cordyceps javanica]